MYRREIKADNLRLTILAVSKLSQIRITIFDSSHDSKDTGYLRILVFIFTGLVSMTRIQQSAEMKRNRRKR
jgi:MFS-type transporter involved in bile tolerance (Atg22 family)